MSRTRREQVHSCIHPDTYRYFLDHFRADALWDECGKVFGPWEQHPTLPIRELHCKAFVLRAPDSGTPVTLLRKTACSHDELDRFHSIVGWLETQETEILP